MSVIALKCRLRNQTKTSIFTDQNFVSLKIVVHILFQGDCVTAKDFEPTPVSYLHVNGTCVHAINKHCKIDSHFQKRLYHAIRAMKYSSGESVFGSKFDITSTPGLITVSENSCYHTIRVIKYSSAQSVFGLKFDIISRLSVEGGCVSKVSCIRI